MAGPVFADLGSQLQRLALRATADNLDDFMAAPPKAAA